MVLSVLLGDMSEILAIIAGKLEKVLPCVIFVVVLHVSHNALACGSNFRFRAACGEKRGHSDICII